MPSIDSKSDHVNHYSHQHRQEWDEFMVEYERARKANNNSSVIYPPASNTNNTDNHFRNGIIRLII
ncbi:hypothetical protein T03_3566 [Trichinella britovi]|uniref:Uncharacterized protein n=1 Tax=Trichinella britovi TaxID=45882 RepID=A0A0V1CYC6_TRIBR|nr:hypothetical protein T03_3566 [Trichinella britovi]